jgi:menaquinone-dependent protoporphyrinogen oxidase
MMTMTGTLLIAYATRYGSTREVAETVANTLRELGAAVEVQQAKDAAVHDGYGGVVLATPFYIGSMLKDATHFLERNKAALERLPVALLTCGPVSAADDMTAARKQLDDALAKLEWLHPVAAEMFVGKYDPSHLRMADKLIAKVPASPLHGIPAHDDRDWAAIRAWAETLPALMDTR